MVRMTSQVLCVLLRSSNGFIPSGLSANLTFLTSSPNSFAYFALKLFHYLPSEGCRSFPSSLMRSADACQDISFASSRFPNRACRRSIIGKYRTDNAGLFSLHVALFFLILMKRDLLGRLLLLPTHGSLIIHVGVTTSVPLVPTRAVVRTALQVLILAPIQDKVVSACMELFKLH